ncbi:MAG TPA: DUF368 domain-containing protein [Egibacteraceae bacterium]|nr:DUF368 domain-containing protein [Egibacteraceae bacterium]
MRIPPTLTHLAQGALMGAADVIPGVSGGTMALVVGIYTRLIASIRAAAALRLREVEWGLVLPLAGGIAVALAIGTVVIPPLLESYPAPTRGLFLGLVVASVPLPWRRIARPGLREVAIVVGAAAVAFALVGIPPRVVAEPAAWQGAAAAAVAICAMILPGVSGAFLLEAMGMYEPTLQAARDLRVGYVAAFGVGAVLGLGAFSQVLGWLLQRRHDVTMAALVGLMAGALRALWPWVDADRGLLSPPSDTGHVLLVGALAVAGFAAVSVLVAVAARREQGRRFPADGRRNPSPATHPPGPGEAA